MKAELVSINQFKNEYFKKFQDLFKNEFGFYFAENRLENFRSIILKYLNLSPFDSFDDFYKYLANTVPGKVLFSQIIDETTIGETYFFRNQPQLDLLKEHILPQIVKSKRSKGINTIKVWSAGCSTGEEVYCLAIILLENLPVSKLWDIQILGTDINRKFLKVAEEGIYSGIRPIRHMPQKYLSKYFKMIDEKKFSVGDDIKKITRFANHNLVKDQYTMPQMIDTDIIFCRNVTIYFSNETTKGIINKFYNCLRNEGYLFIGHSETLWQITDQYKILDFPKGFVYQKDIYNTEPQKKREHAITPASIPEFNLGDIVVKGQSAERKTQDLFHLPGSFESRFKTQNTDETDKIRISGNLESIMKIDTIFHEGVKYFEAKEYDEAVKYFNQIIALDPSYLMAHFAKATIFSNEGRYQEAMDALNLLIKTDNLFINAYFLKSILHIKLHEIQDAILSLQKVIYIDPDHALAYFHLASLYKETNALKQSRLAWTNLKRICKKFNDLEIVPLSDNLTYGTLETIADKAIEEIKV